MTARQCAPRSALKDRALAEEYVEIAEAIAWDRQGAGIGDWTVHEFFGSEAALAHAERLFFRFPDGKLGERLSRLVEWLEYRLGRCAGE